MCAIDVNHPVLSATTEVTNDVNIAVQADRHNDVELRDSQTQMSRSNQFGKECGTKFCVYYWSLVCTLFHLTEAIQHQNNQYAFLSHPLECVRHGIN